MSDVRGEMGGVAAQAPQHLSRVEVIDHRDGVMPFGRVYQAWGAKVELSLQDGGTTLKIFVSGPVMSMRDAIRQREQLRAAQRSEQPAP